MHRPAQRPKPPLTPAGRRAPRPRARVRAHTADTPAELTILAATDELLATTSLTDLTVTHITDHAGLSRPTFYFYYPTKYAVVATLLDRVFAEIFQAVTPWLERDPGSDPEPTLRAGLHAAAELWSSHHAIRAAHEHWHAAAELTTVWLAIMERFRTTLATEIARERQTGTPGLDPELLSTTLIWASERLLYITALGTDPTLTNSDQAVEGLLGLWLPTIYASPYPRQHDRA
jgi:TetR/AcrR family transcriptional regulator, ethionamide resistance regulator